MRSFGRVDGNNGMCPEEKSPCEQQSVSQSALLERLGEVFRKFWISKLILFLNFWEQFELVHEMNNAGAALDSLIQLKVQLRGVLDDHPAGEKILELSPFALEQVDDVFALLGRPDYRHVDVGVLQVWSDVHLLNSDKLGIKDDFLS